MKRATENRQTTTVISRPAHARQRTPGIARALALLTVGALTAFVLTGCTGGSSAGTQPAAGPSAVATTESGTAAAVEPGSPKPGTAGASGATAAENPATAAMKQTVTDALSRLAAGTPRPATAQVTEALTGAGVAPAVLEVSASRTPTGLEADAIESAVLQDTDCVLGHIRDGSVTVTVLPVLASGKCFVGAGA
ncbi:hypothetical protein GCM10009712_43220 [Pseudarthrobacter sulfonivorans]|uniref:DUF6993 domain-containing protein n=1 Tax=Pseudarthrobacter sulfonivorans TaxID=121292 RepID=UPI001CC31E40|nr:hypothetical protein [Pseudarthrobacter sulfonivorans]